MMSIYLLMTLSVSNFFCKDCKITFEGEYKPQQRPRKSCPKCHKMCEITKSKEKTDTETRGRTTSTSPLPKYDKINEKVIEDILLRLVNGGLVDTALVRNMVEFFIKIKSKTDTMEDDLDMEVLKEIGLKITNSN